MSLKSLRAQISKLQEAASYLHVPADSVAATERRNAERLAMVQGQPEGSAHRRIAAQLAIHDAVAMEEPGDVEALIAALGSALVAEAIPDGLPAAPSAYVRARHRAWHEGQPMPTDDQTDAFSVGGERRAIPNRGLEGLLMDFEKREQAVRLAAAEAIDFKAELLGEEKT